jgi:hypothetical protein
VAPSSSAKKVARLASRGKGRKVRFQGGSVFPIAVILVVALGLLAIVYGRQSRPSDGSGVPRVNDGVNTDAHWHAAFGIFICDTFQPKIIGTKEEQGIDSSGNTVLLNDKFRILGVHSHGDGIIHYHPYSTKSSGNRAKLGVFLDVYDIKLNDTEMVMPADQGGDKWSTKDTKCDGKDTDLTVRVWPNFSKPTEFHDVVTDFNNIRITNDGMVFVVAFVPKGTPVPQPDWAAQLPTLGATDGGNVAPETTLVGETTLVPPVPIDTSLGGSTPSTPASGDTTVGGSGAPTTTEPVLSTSTTTPATTTTGG